MITLLCLSQFRTDSIRKIFLLLRFPCHEERAAAAAAAAAAAVAAAAAADSAAVAVANPGMVRCCIYVTGKKAKSLNIAATVTAAAILFHQY